MEARCAAIAERFVVPDTSTSSTPAASSARPPAPVTINACRAARSSGGPLVFEANEQVRRKPRELPEHEQRENVVAENDAEHRSHEPEQRGVEAAGVGVTFEVTAGVQDDERADAGNQGREQQPQAIEVERQRQSERRRPRQLDQAASSGDRSPHFIAKEYGQQGRPRGEHPRSMRESADEPGREDRDHERREDEADH